MRPPSRPVGRPRSCTCGECFKCKRADYMRRWWNNLTPEERRAKTARRDPEQVRLHARRKMAKRRVEGTPQQQEVIAAHLAVKAAIRRGDLVRDPCEFCGAEEVHGHHDDYSKPLEVRWLCPECHRALHGMGAKAA